MKLVDEYFMDYSPPMGEEFRKGRIVRIIRDNDVIIHHLELVRLKDGTAIARYIITINNSIIAERGAKVKGYTPNDDVERLFDSTMSQLDKIVLALAKDAKPDVKEISKEKWRWQMYVWEIS